MQVNLAYTWAHGRGYTDEDSGDGPGFFRIPRFYDRTYGDLNQDIRQNFQMTFIYETPFGKGQESAHRQPAGRDLGRMADQRPHERVYGHAVLCSRRIPAISMPQVLAQIADCLSDPRYVNDWEQRPVDRPRRVRAAGRALASALAAPIACAGPGLCTTWTWGSSASSSISEKVTLGVPRRGLQHDQHPSFRAAKQPEV